MLVLVVPLLLVGVALLAVVRYHDQRQSSWQGVGFGMFATYDNRVSRFTRVDITVDGTTTRVDARTGFDELVDRSEVVPLGPAPTELARRVLERTQADSVVVEIWGIAVDPSDAGLGITIEPIRRVEVP